MLVNTDARGWNFFLCSHTPIQRKLPHFHFSKSELFGYSVVWCSPYHILVRTHICNVNVYFYWWQSPFKTLLSLKWSQYYLLFSLSIDYFLKKATKNTELIQNRTNLTKEYTPACRAELSKVSVRDLIWYRCFYKLSRSRPWFN